MTTEPSNDQRSDASRLGWVARGVLGVGYALLGFALFWPQDLQATSAIRVRLDVAAVMVQTLSLHVGLLLLLVGLRVAVARRWRSLLWMAPLLLAAWAPSLWALRPRATPDTDGPALRLLNLNLLSSNTDIPAVRREIEAADADIILLLEYTPAWRDALAEPMRTTHPHARHVARTDSFGMALFSKRPFLEPPELHVLQAEKRLPQFRVVMEHAGRAVVVYGIHLMPPASLALQRIHRRQLADLLEVVAREERPFILAGDLNFEGHTSSATLLEAHGLFNAHDVGGWGRGATWPAGLWWCHLLGVRLDHVYLCGGLTCIDCDTGPNVGSDHLPVRATIGFSR